MIDLGEVLLRMEFYDDEIPCLAGERLVACFTDSRSLVASDPCDWLNEGSVQMGVKRVSCGISDIPIHGFV